MTRTLIVATLLSAATAATALGQTPSAATTGDSRWDAFIGCWRAVDDPAGTGARVCVVPAHGGATFTTIVGGQRISHDTRLADGTARAVDSDGCRGTETVRWSERGLRLYRTATISCDGGTPRTLATASFFVAGPAWVDVETVEHEGSTSVRVSRLVRAASQVLPDGTTITRSAGARGLAPGATANLTVDDVIDLTTALPADGVQAALAEAPAPFHLNAKALAAMADAGVGDKVIDLMVGITYPTKFQVERAVSGGWAGGLPSGSAMADPFFAPIIGPAALFNCYSSYGWAASSYWGNCTGFDPGWLAYPGYYNGYWGAFGPNWIQTQAGAGGPTVPAAPQAEGRLVNGRGYTQVRPVDTSFTMGSDGGRNGAMGDHGSSGGSSGGGVSGSGYSGGGGGGDRMAVPRGPGER